MTRALKKRPFHRTGSFLLLLIIWGVPGTGCGRGDDPQDPFPPPAPVSCDDLSLSDPKTGGSFSCIACVRSWRWEAPAPSTPLFLVMELDCQSTTDGRLTLLDPQASVLWEMPVKAGDRQRICVPHAPEAKGTCSLFLSGAAPGGLTSFTGSIWINLYDPYGERVAMERYDLP